MILDVRPILRDPGQRLSFSFEMDLSDLEFTYPLLRPVAVEGEVRSSADVLTLDFTARSALDARCDRCGKPVQREQEVTCRYLLAEELQNEDSDDIVLLEDGKVDLADLARTAFILGMDTKILCSEDCKGLCPRCGADLNNGPCGCQPEGDPRLAVLAKLLENK